MLALKIALRYLLSRKSHSTINLITSVAACGVGVITAAMICMLSVFNGFESLVSNLTSRFDPDLRIEPAVGKTFADSDSLRHVIASHPDVEVLGSTLDETVLMNYNGHQMPAHMKGVEKEAFARVTSIDSILLGTDEFLLEDPVVQYCVPGAGLAAAIGIGQGFVRPITIYCPRRVGKINVMRPDEAFTQSAMYCSNVFMVQQAGYDNEYFLCSIGEARRLLGDSLLTSAYEVKLRHGANARRVSRELQDRLSASPATASAFRILDRYEQQADAYRIMQIEKWITFMLIACIMLIASFNAVGALSMLIIDKESQITTLRNLGADLRLVRKVFTYEGWLITGTGALGGIIIGSALCLAQQHFGLIALGNGNSAQYIVSAYPVVMQWGDVALTILTVMAVGWASTFYTLRSSFAARQ